MRRFCILVLCFALVVTGCSVGRSAEVDARAERASGAPNDPYLWFRGNLVESDPAVTMIDGLPHVSYASAAKPQANAVTITQFGLAHYSSGHRARALRAADWLVEHQNRQGAWSYAFDFYVESADETLRAPWVSGMAQGQAMSLLVRAWQLTGDETYLMVAHRALRPMMIGVDKGGVRRLWRGEHLFFEEYPTQRRSYVLNGFLFAIIGVHDLSETGDARARRLWRLSERTAARIIPKYSYGLHDSVYGLGFKQPGGPRPFPVGASIYAQIHVDLAHAMHRITGRQVYSSMARRWSGALP
jgi:hypothetical protein